MNTKLNTYALQKSRRMRVTLPSLYKKPGAFHVLTHSSLYKPPYTARVQADGSFSMNYKKISRTAILLTNVKGENYTLCKTYFEHRNSTESEWCSILDGIKYSLRKDQDAIELENDNLGVITSLIERKVPRHSYLADYYHLIFRQIRQFEYLGIRWIPRERNRADDLFRV